MSEVKHTPTPWQRSGVRQKLNNEDCIMIGPDGYNIVALPIGRNPKDHAGAFCDAAFIVLAVNSYHSLADENTRLREALKPSGDTKAAYIGEFQFSEEIFDGETETYITVKRTVPWTTVKEIMAAISARAALTAQDGGKTVSPEIGGDHG